MDRIIFTEEFCQPENLLPFTLVRQIQDIRVGILTIREKWEHYLGVPSFDKNEDDYKDLDRAIVIDREIGDDVCYMIHGNILPTPELVAATRRLKNGEFITAGDNAGIIFRFTGHEVIDAHKIRVSKAVPVRSAVLSIRYPWDIFQLNDLALRQDFSLLTANRSSAPVPVSNTVINPTQIFLEDSALVEHSLLNASEGPIYIGRDAQVMEGCLIRGPFAMGEGALLKMGAKVYGATTLGPGCTVGGEVKNSVLFGYSNKAHDGYLGDSVIGEWCNLGAGTSNSNLKNNASQVKVWTRHGEKEAGIKCGVLMGDYTKTAINTTINTGTVTGICCNLFGTGLTPKYVPNFSWGHDGVQRYNLKKALKDIGAWKKLKNKELTPNEKTILTYIFDHY